MRNSVTAAALVFISAYASSCITVAPVHGSYEKAGTLGKGNIELSGNFTHHMVASGGETEAVNNNIGFRGGYGVSNEVDIKFRYENLKVIHKKPGLDFKASYYSLIPKINFKPGGLSLFVPFSLYSFKRTTGYGEFKTTSYSIAPHLIRTFTISPNKVDFSTSSNLEYIFGGNEEEDSSNEFLVGFNFGAGFSSDLSKWAIRPEIGYLTDSYFTGGVFNFGVALQVMLNTSKKAN